MDERKLFESRIKKYKNMVQCIIARHCMDGNIRHDLMQQTFLQAWIYRDSFEGKSQYSTWLCRIAINVTINYLVAQKSRVKILDDNEYPYEQIYSLQHYLYMSPDVGLSAMEELEEVKDYILTMNEDLQKALVMSVVYGKNYEEIARAVGIPVGTVRSRIFNARKKLRARFGKAL